MRFELAQVFTTDNVIRGGGNIIVEVMRLAIKTLADCLALRNFPLPRKTFWHFDNCAENKASFSSYFGSVHD